MKTILTTVIALILYSVCYTQTHQLWITAELQGIDNKGAIFVTDGSDNNFHSVYDCYDKIPQPTGNIVMAANGLIYGCNPSFCQTDRGVLYAYNKETDSVTNVHFFGLDPESGLLPYSGLNLGNDGNLYGLTNVGGNKGGGVIFKVDPSDNIYHVLHHFDSVSGYRPFGGVIQLSDGKLYGMTTYGGLHDAGVIFSFDLSNSTYSVLHHFNNTTGGTPWYSNLLKATDGKLYGMTAGGGLNLAGVIFSFDLSGNIYTDLYDFDGTRGANPNGTLTQATDGNLYGVAGDGGAHGYGALFYFDPLSGRCNNLFDFDITTGYRPQRDLLQAANGKLYGTTLIGGASNAGVVFSYDISSNMYAKVYELDSITGLSPSSNVLEIGASSPLAINVLSKTAELNLAPNPATNTVTISIDERMIGSTATLSDITGRKMAAVELTTSNQQLTTSNLANGVYFVTVSSREGRSGTKKLVVSH
jgi:uncharacterized repeat protein (TIGR03803 family)